MESVKSSFIFFHTVKILLLPEILFTRKKIVALVQLHRNVWTSILSAKFFSAKCQNANKHLNNLKAADDSDGDIRAVFIDGSLNDLTY